MEVREMVRKYGKRAVSLGWNTTIILLLVIIAVILGAVLMSTYFKQGRGIADALAFF